MLSTIVAIGGLAAAALMAQPTQAGPLGLGLSVQSGGGQVQPVFHEPDYRLYRAPPVYSEPPTYAPAVLPPGQIEWLLRRNGYSRLEVVALDGPIYTVQGIDPWDNYVEMKVFGSDGRVLRSDVIEARLYDTPFAERPPVAIPDDGPRVVGALPQSPPSVASQTEPRPATAPLPRERPAYRPEPSLPDPEAGDPIDESGQPDRQASERDPLVVY